MAGSAKIRVLITGATGFIGRHLPDFFPSDKYSLSIVRRKPGLLPESFRDINEVYCDLSQPDLHDLPLNHTDILINLAAEKKQSELMENMNTLMPEKLFRLSAEKKVTRFIHLSSVGVYGIQHSFTGIDVDEHFPFQPKNTYEKTKADGEERLIRLSEKFPHTHLVILRPTNVFGEWHPQNYLLHILTRVLQQKTIPYAKGSFVNYVYAGDVARAIYLATGTELPNLSVFNVGNAIPAGEFLDIMGSATGKMVQKKAIPEWCFKLLQNPFVPVPENLKLKLLSLCNRVTYNDHLASTQLKYHPDPEAGLKQTVYFYQRQKLL